MKLIIQIPCYNEAEFLPETLEDLPRYVAGFDVVEWLVVDDGSLDNTAEVARKYGVDHIIKHSKNLGLARAFTSGLQASIDYEADVIVNTDADNQYAAESIPDLVAPILANKAEIVIGTRPIETIEHFSVAKKILQKLGSLVVRIASGTDIQDAPSGFRAFSRSAAKRMHVFSKYTYTLETIIQAGQKDLLITSVPIKINGATRQSRLVKSIPSYIIHSILTIVRICILYQPFKFFSLLGGLLIGAGTVLGIRFLFFYLTGSGFGHVQSVILAAALFGVGAQTILIAFVADLVAANRKLLEKIDLNQKELIEQVQDVVK